MEEILERVPDQKKRQSSRHFLQQACVFNSPADLIIVKGFCRFVLLKSSCFLLKNAPEIFHFIILSWPNKQTVDISIRGSKPWKVNVAKNDLLRTAKTRWKISEGKVILFINVHAHSKNKEQCFFKTKTSQTFCNDFSCIYFTVCAHNRTSRKAKCPFLSQTLLITK